MVGERKDEREQANGGRNNRLAWEETKKLFAKTLDNEEEILWLGKPFFKPYMLINIQDLIFILAFPYILNEIMRFIKTIPSSQENYYLIITFLVICALVVIGFLILFIWGSIVSLFSYRNNYYVITNKRVIASFGIKKMWSKSVFYTQLMGIDMDCGAVLEKIILKLFNGRSVGFYIGKSDEIGRAYEITFYLSKTDADIVNSKIKSLSLI